MISQLEVAPSVAGSAQEIRGAVHVFINAHRSFFTTVMAQSMRVAGQGTPVLVVQLLKGGIDQGPDNIVPMGDCLHWVRCGIERCIDTPHLEPDEQAAFQALWDFTKTAIQSGQYGLVVLDELGLALRLGLVDEAEAIDLLERRPVSMDVAITGPDMPEALMEMAEQVTHLRHLH